MLLSSGILFGENMAGFGAFCLELLFFSLHTHLWRVSAVAGRVRGAAQKGARRQDASGLMKPGCFEQGFWGHFLIFLSETLYSVKCRCYVAPRSAGREGAAGRGPPAAGGTRGCIPASLWGLFWRAALPLRVGWPFLLKASVFSCL